MIPIQNVYYLFLYAWDKFPAGKAIEVGRDQGPELPNLLARVLLSCTQTLLRRGLDRDYQPITEELAAPRGRFLLAESVKQNTMVAGRIVCAFDEFSTDTQPNRIIKATLKALARSPQVDVGLRRELTSFAKRLAQVSDIRRTNRLFRSLQIGRHNGRYGLALQVCRFTLDLMLPEEAGQGVQFADVLKDEVRMSDIFERFVRNFYRLEQSKFSANIERINWDVECLEEVRQFLPEMRTDVTLRSANRIIVVDTKYYQQTLVSRYGDSRPKVRSNHLYQMRTYLQNLRLQERHEAIIDGVLLYPSIDGKELRLDMRLAKHRTQVWSIDFAQPWQHIHTSLLSLLEC